jgi:HEPN domain-containing protein
VIVAATRLSLHGKLIELCGQIIVTDDITQLVSELNSVLDQLDECDREQRRHYAAKTEEPTIAGVQAAVIGGK